MPTRSTPPRDGGAEPGSAERTITLSKSEKQGVPGRRTVVVVGAHGVIELPLPDRGALVMGRDPGASIQVDDPFVSKRHALLFVGDGTMTLVDEGSANGTFVNGVRVAVRQPRDVAATDVIHMGGSSVLFRDRQTTPPRRARGPLVADPAMQRIYDLLATIGPSRVSVLLLGETGVGKEVLASALHEASPRADAPLVRVNCAAMSPSLVEAELFGYERGAFTGAVTAKQGLLEAAHKGTLFLDEIGEAPLEMQAKLLRFIESGELLRVGSVQARTVDVRIVAATNRILPEMVGRGEFRADLYFRLNGITLSIPPLRERRDEILPFAEELARQAAERSRGWSSVVFTPRAKQKLLSHAWPGNVRELRACVERAVLLAKTPTLDEELLVLDVVTMPRPPPATHTHAPHRTTRTLEVPSVTPPPPDTHPSPAVTLRPPTAPASRNAAGPGAEDDDPERAAILAALAECAGNQSRAAERLGISRRTLLKRLDDYDVPRPRKR